MDRRRFLMLLGLSPLISKLLLREAFAAEKSLVAIADDRDYTQATVKAINALGGMRRFVRPGNVVVVKPNIGWDRSPEQAANTHPLVVRAVVSEALRAGARKVKVFDRSCNDPRRCYVTSGIAAALRGLKNVELKQIENERFRPVRLNGRTLRDWELYDEALSADVFINVPVAKHHGLTGLTLGLKNVMGVMGGNRGSIHRHIDSALADINAVVKSRLTVIDATRILTANGPQGGDPRDVKVLNKVLASSDIVAADAVATTLFGLRPEAITTTVAAYRRGLGEMNMSGIRILRV
ncbi:MAG: DUF362 domain-containing protein [Deltaproteobacteria bacterium]|nr:DUF362 domain-containing protein [Deltaproteobacteria bacterium]TLN03671.1 MAG: DUF362 domain-containing protein [bacterium]